MAITDHDSVYFRLWVVPAVLVIALWAGSNVHIELGWRLAASATGIGVLTWVALASRRNNRLRTERALHEANARLQGLLDGATQVAIIATDLAGVITVFNTGAERMLGYSASAVVGSLSLQALHFGPDLDRRAAQLTDELNTAVAGFDVLVAKVRRHGHEVREWTYVRKNNSRLVVSLAVTAIRDANGILSGFLAVASDISDRKRAEAKLRTAMEAAEVATRAKSDFLATMSHEIRTPMNGVIGMTRLLMATDLTEPQREYAETIRSSGEALLGIINDVLDFSKIEAGKLDLDVVDFELQSLLNDVTELFAESAARKGICMTLVIEDDVPARLRADAGRLRQILSNLISNAVKFTDSGRVMVSVSRQSGAAPGIVLRFEIADTGVGLHSEAREWLFKAFSQGDPTTTRKYGGTGLGLAISSRLVHMMGGDIGVESDLGRGSAFWFTVRVERQIGKFKAAAGLRLSILEAPRAPAPADSRPRAHVLVAEDNLTNQRVATYMLEKLGYSSETVSSGSEAVNAVSQSHYDAILMDCHMPEMDGFEATSRIRAAESGGWHIPIIAMTANALDGDRERCLHAGMNDYLAKPVSIDALEKTLSYWTASTAVGNAKDPSCEALIAHFCGDIRLLEDVVGVFLGDAPSLLASVGAALDRHDLSALQRALHTLKGALGNFGQSSALHLALDMERAAQAEDLQFAASSFPAIQKAVAALCRSLSTACSRVVAAS